MKEIKCTKQKCFQNKVTSKKREIKMYSHLAVAPLQIICHVTFEEGKWFVWFILVYSLLEQVSQSEVAYLCANHQPTVFPKSWNRGFVTELFH